jgi:uncharacterized protein YodC (DUF2158 family)
MAASIPTDVVLRSWIDALLGPAKLLNDWEERFVASVSVQLELQGSLSPKQVGILPAHLRGEGVMGASRMKAGDLVVLNSGGPLMKVERIDEQGDAVCSWQAGGRRHIAMFPPTTLFVWGVRPPVVRQLRTAPCLRVRGFRTRPSAVLLLRTIDRNRAVVVYQRAMSVRTQ